LSDPLYRKELLRLAADAHGAGRLAAPDVTGVAANPACGDKVTVDVTLAKGKIEDIAHETRACVLAQASASILGRSLSGRSRHDLRTLRDTVTAMLEADGPPPSAPFSDFAIFRGALGFQGRHRCVLLPIDAVLDALDGHPASSGSGES
jgi:NifU-like protein involved in Fe-S cluster formation